MTNWWFMVPNIAGWTCIYWLGDIRGFLLMGGLLLFIAGGMVDKS